MALVTVRDQTHHYSFRMTEKAALGLSSHDNAADFKAAHEAGTLWFPILCSLKLIRKCTDVKPDTAVASSAGQPAYLHEFDSHIVDASEQSLTEPPTMESLLLIDLLASKLDSVDTFLPAALHMILKSVHYSMVVNYAPQDLVTELSQELAPAPSPDTTLARACFQAFALVEATTKSEMVDLDGQGYKLITEGVKDVLAPDSPTTYTLTAFCTLSNLQDFKLDPPRGTKTTTAFVVITDILPGAGGDEPVNFIVDSILLVPRDVVPEVVATMKNALLHCERDADEHTQTRTRMGRRFLTGKSVDMPQSLSPPNGGRAARLQTRVNRVSLALTGQCCTACRVTAMDSVMVLA